MMKPTDVLMEEHKIILSVLDWAERECEYIRRTGAINREEIGKAIDFIQNFADRCHQAKEEEILFAAMRQKGMPSQGGPIAVILAEHESGRVYIQAARELLPQAAGGDSQAQQLMVERFMGYIHLLRTHTAKEDNVLFPMAERLFTGEELEKMSGEFEKAEKKLGKDFHEKYHRLADDLASR